MTSPLKPAAIPGMLKLILTDAHFLLPFAVLLLGIALLCTLR
jgi:hypothetical protein